LHQDSSNQAQLKVKRATMGFVISLVAGILILVEGVVRLVRGRVFEFGVDVIRRRIFAFLTLREAGVIAIVFGILVVIGACLIYSSGKEVAGGLIVLVFSILSIFVGGGFLAGFILGIIGGALGLAKE
jgi:hypothetical protein